MDQTLKGFRGWQTLSGLERLFMDDPQGSRSSNPGLKFANAFGVILWLLSRLSDRG